MWRTKYTIGIFVVLMMLAAGGCRPPQITVKELGSTFPFQGTVNLDGRPMSAGTIKVVPVDKEWQRFDDLPTDEGSIKDGRFQLNVSLGYKLVEIYGDDSVTIPEQFNTQTTLKAYVHHATEDVFRFDVKSK